MQEFGEEVKMHKSGCKTVNAPQRVRNTAKRKLARFSEIDKNEQTYNLAAYLIAQLGKNFNDRVALIPIFHCGLATMKNL